MLTKPSEPGRKMEPARDASPDGEAPSRAQAHIERLLLRPAEVADALGICRTQAYNLINAGTLPSIRIGTSVRVPLDALRRWIDEQVGEDAQPAQRVRN